jgi:hypothetical protein
MVLGKRKPRSDGHMGSLVTPSDSERVRFLPACVALKLLRFWSGCGATGGFEACLALDVSGARRSCDVVESL